MSVSKPFAHIDIHFKWKDFPDFEKFHFLEIRAQASGSRPARRNLSPDLRIWARAGRAAISIPTHVFYENHGIPENRVGYIHSKWKDFRDFHKFHFSGNPSPSLRIPPHASESEPRPQDLGSGRAGRHIHTYPCVLRKSRNS